MPIICVSSYNNGKTAITPLADIAPANVILAAGGDPLKVGCKTFTFGDATRDPRVLPQKLLEDLVAANIILIQDCVDSTSFGWYVPFSNGEEDLKWATTTEDFVRKLHPIG